MRTIATIKSRVRTSDQVVHDVVATDNGYVGRCEIAMHHAVPDDPSFVHVKEAVLVTCLGCIGSVR